jgi:hypothetical protein
MTHLNRTLTQTFTSGATAIAIITGLGLVATPQAKAAQLTCTTSSPCVLSDFLGTGNFFVAGDKQFGNFEYTELQGNTPNANSIKVFGEVVDNVFSIGFTGRFLARNGETTTASLTHTVDILKPNAYFETASLSANTQGPFAGITETIFDATTSTQVAQLEVNTNNIPTSLFDSEDISELKLKSIKVQKDFTLTGQGRTASFSIFRQSYTQVEIPEPASMLGLLTVGGLGVALKRKREN